MTFQRCRTLLVTTALAGATLVALPGPARAASGALPAGSQLWASRYVGFNAGAQSTAMAVSPAGSRVFVTGLSKFKKGTATGNWVTLTYDAKTGLGRLLNTQPVGAGAAPSVISVSRDGTKVFVAGPSPSAPHGFMIVAYDAAHGRELWASTSSIAATAPAAIAASVDSTLVFVTGSTAAANGVASDYLTIAYNEATGAQQWVSRYNGRAHGTDQARGITITPSGKAVLVTGSSQGKTSGADAATVAYSAATGAQQWVSRYNGAANGDDFGKAVAVNQGGKIAYVTGGSQGRTSGRDLVTIGYNVATGSQVWAQRYNGGGKSSDQGLFMTLFRGTGPVLVTGQTSSTAGRTDVTIEYNPQTGKPIWARQFKALGNFAFNPAAMVLGTLASLGYVAGDTRLKSGKLGFGTVAFRLDGSVVWRSHYSGPAHGGGTVSGLAIGPQTGGTLYETGSSPNGGGMSDIATVAYVARSASTR